MMALDVNSDIDEDALLAGYARGDMIAARRLADHVTPRIFAHAFRLLGTRAEAEDITQEAMLRLWKIAPNWDGERARVTTWLYRVTANLCVDHLRKFRPQTGTELPDLADDSPSNEAHLLEHARNSALQNALMKLPERQRQAVILRHLEELSNPEIAQIMDLGVEAVESLTARGKRRLAELMRNQKEALGYQDAE